MQKTELPDLAINQEVFFLAKDSGIISERYAVGGQVKLHVSSIFLGNSFKILFLSW